MNIPRSRSRGNLPQFPADTEVQDLALAILASGSPAAFENKAFLMVAAAFGNVSRDGRARLDAMAHLEGIAA